MAQQNLGNLTVKGAPGAIGAAGAAGAGGAAGATSAASATGALPELLSPADVAKSIGVSEDDVMTIIQSGELAAKKIGTSYRVTRAALEKYLGS